jgi:hypothetical protein
MRTIEELVETAKTVGCQLRDSGISWAQISMIATLIHDSANFAVNLEGFRELEGKVVIK